MRITVRWAHRDWLLGVAWEKVPRRLLLFVLPSICVVLHFTHRRCTICRGLGDAIYQPWVHQTCTRKRTRRI